MRRIGLISLIIGLTSIAFPSFVGEFVIGSAAMMIAALSLLSMLVLVMGRRYMASIISLVFLSASVRIMYAPQLLLKYVGAALIISSVIQLLLTRRNVIFLSSGTSLVLGILAYMNSHASLVVTSVILGILFAGFGGVILFWDSFILSSPRQSIHIWNRSANPNAKRKIKIDEQGDDEIEEAKFTEIDDE